MKVPSEEEGLRLGQPVGLSLCLRVLHASSMRKQDGAALLVPTWMRGKVRENPSDASKQAERVRPRGNEEGVSQRKSPAMGMGCSVRCCGHGATTRRRRRHHVTPTSLRQIPHLRLLHHQICRFLIVDYLEARLALPTTCISRGLLWLRRLCTA